jgi:hypothetical protein
MLVEGIGPPGHNLRVQRRTEKKHLSTWDHPPDGESVLSNSPGNRRRAILLPIGLLMLCMAVFGWGLQYKLSLYQGKDSISHVAPVAKLLSQKERPVAGKTLGARPDWAPAWPVFLILMMAFGLCPAAVRYLRAGSLEGCRSAFPPCLMDIFVRPPPVALSLP